MDEAARTSGPPVDGRSRGPREIREEIERTREKLGETVEALAAKTDVKAQARAKVKEAKGRAREKVEAVKARVADAKAGEGATSAGSPAMAGDLAANAADVERAARADAARGSQRGGEAARALRAHPELFGLVAAFAAGILVGSLLGG